VVATLCSCLKSPMKTRASNWVFQWLRVRHSLRSRLLNDSMSPLSHGQPGGM
jgi:hypothetical protein